MRVVLTGDAYFWKRYGGLAPALSKRCGSADIVTSGNLLEILPYRVLNKFARGWLRGPISRYFRSLDRRALGYSVRSRQTEKRWLPYKPDYVLHLFSSFSPVSVTRQRFGMYLDYTMSQAIRDWPPWAEFPSGEQDRWLALERDTYLRADTIFTMSAAVADSVVVDYGIPREKTHVVGSGGNFHSPFEGSRSFGSRKILFYGSEWERKGGDLMLDAFQAVRRAIPDAGLVVIGASRPIEAPGVLSLGLVSQERVRELLLQVDVVAAPSRCDPFPAFIIEAMNYGVPCVVTAKMGIAEHVAGAVLEDVTASTLEAAIVTLLEDRARLYEQSSRGRETVKRCLNWDSVAERIASKIM